MLLQHTDDCRTAIQLASKSAEQHGSRFITRMHVLAGIASAPGSASESLLACGVDLDELRQRALQSPDNDQIRAEDVVGSGIQELERLDHNHLDVGHLLLAMVADRNSDCAGIIRSMGADLDELVAEIERRLPQPTFPLQQALSRFSGDDRVQELRKRIDTEQELIETYVRRADFETAAFHRDQKAEYMRALETLLEQLWHDSKG